MSLISCSRLAVLWRADLFSAKDFLRRALVISVLFLIAHIAGLREFTSLLNGTMGSVEWGWRWSAFFGITYILLYLAFVLLVPPLLLAASFLLFWQKLFTKKPSPP